MAIVTILTLALAALAPSAQERSFDFNKQVDLCATDPAVTVSVDAAEGTTANYAIRLTALNKDVEAFLTALDGKRFGVSALQTPNFSVLFVATQVPAREAKQIRDDVALLCKLGEIAPIRLVLFEKSTGGDRRRLARQKAEEERLRTSRAALATAREAEAAQRRHRQLMRSHPSVEELNVLFRQQWDEAWPLREIRGMTFRRVRDVRCKRIRDQFLCSVGILLLYNNEPEYELLEIEFWRNSDGKLEMSEGPEIIT